MSIKKVKEKMNKQNRKKIITAGILFIAGLIVFTVFLLPYVNRLSETQYQSQIKDWVSSMGVLGPLLILGIQILQIVIAFIPGEPVEILAGALYGAWSGLLICLFGSVIASAAVFRLSKRFGKRLLYSLFGEDNVQNWKWLQDSKKTETITFVLFFIPGTPKDMLTYVIGITKMSAMKFIAISTLARIPSVLSSTMIGSAVRQGEWELSLGLFIITGLVGIVGIETKDRIIDFCRRKIPPSHDANRSCECMDLIEIAHKDRIYPMMFCKMQIEGQLDIQRLKAAVQKTACYVPEILMSFDFKRYQFVDRNLTADDIVIVNKCDFDHYRNWDLSQDAQLKIAVLQNKREENVVVGMSHILTDGSGFLQYLYLLCAVYNGAVLQEDIANCRAMESVFEYIPFRISHIRTADKIKMPPLCGANKGNESHCICSCIYAAEFSAVQKKARQRNVTLNDVFMTAYARVISQQQDREVLTIPCPADLRKTNLSKRALTVANMTGMYQKVSIRVKRSASFDDILLRLHKEMQRQKRKLRCFRGIKILNFVFHKIPSKLLISIIRKQYRINPVSYSNMGKIDDEKLYFDGCSVENCYLTGTYRQAPDFQLSVSTFRKSCTLNCALIGNERRNAEGKYILSEIKRELLNWAQTA